MVQHKPILSAPPQVLVDASHPERSKDEEFGYGGLIFVIVVLTIIGFLMPKAPLGYWELVSIGWITLGFVGIGYWSSKWKSRSKHFKLYMLAAYAGIITLHYVFSHQLWIKVVALVFSIPVWIITVIWTGKIIHYKQEVEQPLNIGSKLEELRALTRAGSVLSKDECAICNKGGDIALLLFHDEQAGDILTCRDCWVKVKKKLPSQ